MKDPHEHIDMPHESEDVRKRDCRKYKELYGKHFTKAQDDEVPWQRFI